MVNGKKKRVLVWVLAGILALAGAFSLRAGAAEAANVVVYDGNQMSTFKRTADAVAARYRTAAYATGSYVNGDSDTYYAQRPSLSAPYSKGVLAQDTLDAMMAMTNFYRYLCGTGEHTDRPVNVPQLQAECLDRNWQFGHIISNDSKPSDMPDAVWQEGFECTHNILAGGYTPTGAITGWMNEGYLINENKWDTLGHRYAIMSASSAGMEFGYAGHIACGRSAEGGGYNTIRFDKGEDTNGDGVFDEEDEGYWETYEQGGTWKFEEAIAAFPCPGPMPNWLISPQRSAWSLQLDVTKVRPLDMDKVVVTVKNLSDGTSYTCTKANELAQPSYDGVDFVQPKAEDYGLYTGSYEVTVEGLTDVATRKPAKVRYTVNFFGEEKAAGWFQDGKNWKLVDQDGELVTGWYHGKYWYYMDRKGVMQTGWTKVDGKWYYLQPGTGYMQTGWQKIGGEWYYLGGNGAMQTGWTKIGDRWYLLASSGEMLTGWEKVSGKWYFLASNGVMQTGWQKIGGVWYYLGGNGAMRTGWEKISGNWYYFASSGVMQTGWQKIGGNWYFFHSNGVMVADTTIGSYRFDENGIWIP